MYMVIVQHCRKVNYIFSNGNARARPPTHTHTRAHACAHNIKYETDLVYIFFAYKGWS